jgi:hypothetical protein
MTDPIPPLDAQPEEAAPYHPPPPTGPQALMRPLAMGAPFQWLAQGFQDFRAHPGIGLFYGICFWLMALTLGLVFRTKPEYVMSIASGCLLVGPFLAMGLYEVSRRRELGHGARSGQLHHLLGFAHPQHGHAGPGADRAGTALGPRLAGGVRGVFQYRHAIDHRCSECGFQSGELGVRRGLFRGGQRFRGAGVFNGRGVDSHDSGSRHRRHFSRDHEYPGGFREHRGDDVMGRAADFARPAGADALGCVGLVLVGPLLGHASWHAYRGAVAWREEAGCRTWGKTRAD